jgi:hypothetical protein|tara:strand:- start:357 stop:521 length:165 start_codon:yes stop_codon:yes gene_type:complete
MSKIGDYNIWLEEKGYLVWDEATDSLVWPASTLDPDKLFHEYMEERSAGGTENE